MNITITAVGTKMPNWVETAYNDYATRLKHYCKLNLVTLPLAKRTKNTNLNDAKKQEGKALLERISLNDHVILLDSGGKQYTSDDFAKYINNLKLHAKNINIMIGGPDGFWEECYNKASDNISLSKLTLPHPIVRVVLLEQLYRAFTILNHHPYHK